MPSIAAIMITAVSNPISKGHSEGGWLALLTCETQSNLVEQNNQFLKAISAKFQADEAKSSRAAKICGDSHRDD
jgi:hypothetical protein